MSSQCTCYAFNRFGARVTLVYDVDDDDDDDGGDGGMGK